MPQRVLQMSYIGGASFKCCSCLHNGVPDLLCPFPVCSDAIRGLSYRRAKETQGRERQDAHDRIRFLTGHIRSRAVRVQAVHSVQSDLGRLERVVVRPGPAK